MRRIKKDKLDAVDRVEHDSIFFRQDFLSRKKQVSKELATNLTMHHIMRMIVNSICQRIEERTVSSSTSAAKDADNVEHVMKESRKPPTNDKRSQAVLTQSLQGATKSLFERMDKELPSASIAGSRHVAWTRMNEC